MKIKHFSLLTLLTAIAVVLGTTPAIGESTSSSEKTFVCQANGDVPITVAKTSDGEMQPIFYWKNEAFSDDTNPEQLCNTVSNQLENYFALEKKSSPIGFKGTNLENIPTVCLTGKDNECQVILFTLAPVTRPVEAANLVLDSILAPQLQENKITDRVRGVQSHYYQVNIWSLLGLKFIK